MTRVMAVMALAPLGSFRVPFHAEAPILGDPSTVRDVTESAYAMSGTGRHGADSFQSIIQTHGLRDRLGRC